MPSAREKLAQRVIELSGERAARIVDLGNGWPARIEVRLGSRWEPVDLYVSQIGSHHRKSYEFRFQNPGQNRPITPGAFPLLVGFTEKWEGPVCVGADAVRRIGDRNRFSVLFVDGVAMKAIESGWAEYHTSSDETIIAFHPSLLPAYVMVRQNPAAISVQQVVDAIDDAGFNDTEDEVVRERARAAVTRVVRSSVFGRRVTNAYGGLCALCGVDWGIVQGAHIYPASAPGSPDIISNGLALCGNHHLLFDDHKIFIDPQNGSVALCPDLAGAASEPCRAFLASTYDHLVVPARARHRPNPDMFRRRYDWYQGKYGWAA